MINPNDPVDKMTIRAEMALRIYCSYQESNMTFEGAVNYADTLIAELNRTEPVQTKTPLTVTEIRNHIAERELNRPSSRPEIAAFNFHEGVRFAERYHGILKDE